MMGQCETEDERVTRLVMAAPITRECHPIAPPAQPVSMVVSFDQDAREPRVVSWDKQPVGIYEMTIVNGSAWLSPEPDKIDRQSIDANALERIAKNRPDDYFLKGSGVLKLLHGIRQLEREVRSIKERERIWTKLEAIRAKQAAKPKHSPLHGSPLRDIK